uniref:Uncharacterized protein n=1 Tax=Oryza glaberrima TaxID=4538 RepID=I1QUT9_ORYGL
MTTTGPPKGWALEPLRPKRAQNQRPWSYVPSTVALRLGGPGSRSWHEDDQAMFKHALQASKNQAFGDGAREEARREGIQVLSQSLRFWGDGLT